MRISRLLNASVEVWREARTSDGMGGWVGGWAKVASVRARVSQPNATERVTADANGADLSHVIYFASTAGVQRGDEIRQGSRVFEVLATFEPSEPGTYLRADTRLRQTAQ